MRKITIKIGIALLFCTTFTFCEKEPIEINESEIKEKISAPISGEGTMVFGKQLDDPYSLENMEIAYASLRNTNTKAPDYKIKPTHKYMRFLPKDNEEWDLLKEDTSIMFFDFPLDYEIIEMGNYYHDPLLPEDAITWQYCVLPIKYKINEKIEHELLYEVYIPSKDNSSKSMDQFLKELEYESMRLTGNLPQEEMTKSKGSWTPKGYIKAWDNIIGASYVNPRRVFDHWEYYDCDGDGELPVERRIIEPIELCKRAVYRTEYDVIDGSYIPIKGAKVSARWYTHVETDITDANGYFQTSSFLFDVNYAIKWERAEYDIRDGSLTQAWYNGPKKGSDWILKIGTGGKSIMYATMHRAAYKQFYDDNLGIRRPTGLGKTKLCYIDEDGTGIFWGDWIDYGILPDIKVWGKDDGIYKPIDRIFATTTHELGHMSHWHLIGIDNYAFTGKVIYESWADAVEWALTNDEYHKMGARFGGTEAIEYDCQWTNQEDWPINVSDIDYTPIFIDLMDDINQRDELHFGSSSYPNDLVEGFTLQYLQDEILKDARGISSLHTSVKAKIIPGVSDTNIDELFAFYFEIL